MYLLKFQLLCFKIYIDKMLPSQSGLHDCQKTNSIINNNITINRANSVVVGDHAYVNNTYAEEEEKGTV